MFSSKSYSPGPFAKNTSIRSLRYQSHPLTRLLRDGIMPTLQSVTILFIGLCLVSVIPHLTSRLDFPIQPAATSHHP